MHLARADRPLGRLQAADGLAVPLRSSFASDFASDFGLPITPEQAAQSAAIKAILDDPPDWLLDGRSRLAQSSRTGCVRSLRGSCSRAKRNRLPHLHRDGARPVRRPYHSFLLKRTAKDERGGSRLAQGRVSTAGPTGAALNRQGLERQRSTPSPPASSTTPITTARDSALRAVSGVAVQLAEDRRQRLRLDREVENAGNQSEYPEDQEDPGQGEALATRHGASLVEPSGDGSLRTAYVITYARMALIAAGDTYDPTAVGPRVRALREAMGLSLRELALRCGVSAAMLSQVERGETSPTLQVAARIAPGLELRLSQLLRLDESELGHDRSRGEQRRARRRAARPPRSRS